MSGAANGHGHDDDLRAELARVRAERDDFEAQYHTLVGKLGQMRSTLGDRLRQDAVSSPPHGRAEQGADTYASPRVGRAG